MSSAPYGSWKSPITSDMIVSKSVRLGQIALDGDAVYWVEMRPEQAGRSVVVRWTPEGQLSDVTPEPFNVRTRVHEYGGGAFTLHKGTVYFSNFKDQRIYRQSGVSKSQAMTPEQAFQFADGVIDSRRNRLICVREDHSQANQEAMSSIVSIHLDTEHSGDILISGNDFYSNPRLSPDGSKLAWLTWNHPNMPWDGTELWIADVQPDGSLSGAQKMAGSTCESIFQPEWSPDGTLYFVSDRTGWWNLYRFQNGNIEALFEKQAEFGLPQWIFGMSTYAFAADNQVVCTYFENGNWSLGILEVASRRFETVDLPFTHIEQVRANSNHAVFIAGSPVLSNAIIRLNLETCQFEILRKSADIAIDTAFLSRPEAIAFSTEQGKQAHAYFYPPQNRDIEATAGEKPPLIVKSHGGPTAAATTSLDLKIQFWTSRGFAVLDVNYGGSTGYGREYRERLNQNWGIVDVDDCINGAKYLVERGLVNKEHIAIVGGSAGGFTTLAALTFRDFFRAGASYYGISDLEAMAKETHKFESRYLDRLIGPYPEQQALYKERSPIYFTERLSCPIILFQGLEDEVVPPAQAELLVTALQRKKLPVAYLAFEGEQHGFRKAENIKRALEAELYFYAQIFEFEPADDVEAVDIKNL